MTLTMALVAYANLPWAMFIPAALAVPVLVALSRIRGEEIDFGRASGAEPGGADRLQRTTRDRALLSNRPLLIFAICAVLFQLANASMLPLVSGMLASEGKRQAAPFVAALIIVPQVIVALLAPWVGQRAEIRGRKPLLLVGFGALPIRVGLNNLSTTVGGTISGAGGSLVKTGRGTLTLTGNNTYTGTTVVDAGTLIVDGSIASSSMVTVNFGGELEGTGAIGTLRIGPGGIFAPGNGTPGSSTTVTGNLLFSPATLYGVQANSQSASFANVTGTATLAGTVGVNVSGTFFIPKVYTILSAGGLVIGRFDSVFDTRPSFEADLSYTPHNVLLSLTFDPLRAVEQPSPG